MKRAWVLLSCAWLGFLASPALAQDYDLLRRGVVKVVPTGQGQARIPGSGLIVRREAGAVYVLTAAHVVEGAAEIGVEFFGTRPLYPARVLGIEGGDPHGLAVLIVEREAPADARSLIMNADTLVRAGEPVTVIGFPRSVAVPWAVTTGVIVGRRGRAIVLSGTVEEGNSGGPLIRAGEVIGVVTQAQRPYAFASPAVIARYALVSWGVRFGDTLRSRGARLTAEGISRMIKERGFNHPAAVAGIGPIFGSWERAYEAKTLGNDRVVIDHATNLMWQQHTSGDLAGNSREEAARLYIDELNRQAYAGFTDWRLPTFEELASLLEARGEDRGQGAGSNRAPFLDPLFDAKNVWNYSADEIIDRNSDVKYATMDFRVGGLIMRGDGVVRAVRSMTAEELAVRVAPRPKP